MSRRLQNEIKPSSPARSMTQPTNSRLSGQRGLADQRGAFRLPPLLKDVLNSQGQPLDQKTRASLESRFGYEFGRMDINPRASNRVDDGSEARARMLSEQVAAASSPLRSAAQDARAGFDFRQVRIHADERAAKSAEAINARAFTVGSEIVFAANQYSPQTSEGERLLAHELTHVVQQGGSNAAGKYLQRQPATAEPSEEKPVPIQQSAPAQATAPPVNQPAAQVPAAQVPAAQPEQAQQPAEAGAEEQKAGMKLSADDEKRLQEMVANGVVPLMPNPVELNGNREDDTANLAEYFLLSSANDIRNPLDPDPLFGIISEVTRSKQVFRDYKKDAIEPAYDKIPPPEKRFLQVRHWPRHLPTAERTVAERVSVIKGMPKLLVPKPKNAPELTPEQRAMVDLIKENREAIQDPTEELKLHSYGGNRNAGYMYIGKSAYSTPKGTKVPGDERKTQVNEAIWKELSGEGGVSAINTYDEQILSWGRGFGASTGGLRKVMELLPVPLRYKLLEAGVAYIDGKWLVVDTQTGLIEQENNALRLIQFDKKLLSLLINLAENNSEEFAETQWKAVAATLGNYPASVLSWDDSAIALAAHCIHWRATGWGPYKDTGGNIKKIVQVITSKVGKVDPNRGGATFLGPVQTIVLLSFAKGAAKQAFSGPEPLPGNISKGGYAGHVFLEASGKNKGTYWHLYP